MGIAAGHAGAFYTETKTNITLTIICVEDDVIRISALGYSINTVNKTFLLQTFLKAVGDKFSQGIIFHLKCIKVS